MDRTVQLQHGLHALQLHLPTSIQTHLLAYLELLAQWNQVYNLTAIHNIAEMIPKHILDSLAILPYVNGTSILDVGTGAGLPGLLLAIACPHWQYILIDSNAKKIRFVKQAILELKITNVDTFCTRIETFQYSSGFNTIIARAYANLHHFYATTIHLCAQDGYLLAMKGIYPTTEMESIAHLPMQLECIPITVPQLAAQRHVVIMRPLCSIKST